MRKKSAGREGRGMKTDQHPRQERPPAGPLLNKDEPLGRQACAFWLKLKAARTRLGLPQ